MTEFDKYSGLPSSKLDSAKYRINNSLTPMIIDERKDNVAMIDVFSKLMSNRIIYLGTPIDDIIANIMNSQLLYLDHQDDKTPITIYINTPGGSVYDGMSIYDTIKYISAPVYTVNAGLAASMGSIILAAGEKGNRKALKHSRTMLHQPMQYGGGYRQASDISIMNDEVQNLKKELYQALSENTGQTMAEIERVADRDCWLNSTQAKNFGIIDDIIQNHPSKIIKKITPKSTAKKKPTKNG